MPPEQQCRHETQQILHQNDTEAHIWINMGSEYSVRGIGGGGGGGGGEGGP